MEAQNVTQPSLQERPVRYVLVLCVVLRCGEGRTEEALPGNSDGA